MSLSTTPPELLLKTFSYADLRSLARLASVSKSLNQAVDTIASDHLQERGIHTAKGRNLSILTRAEDLRKYPDYLIAAIGINTLLNAPPLDLGGRMGNGDQIDFLTRADFAAPVVRGIDKFNRPFVSFHLCYKDSILQKAQDMMEETPHAFEMSLEEQAVLMNQILLKIFEGRLTIDGGLPPLETTVTIHQEKSNDSVDWLVCGGHPSIEIAFEPMSTYSAEETAACKETCAVIKTVFDGTHPTHGLIRYS